MKRVRRAVELLAKEWPQDYLEGAVEWHMVQQGRNSSAGNANKG
ncbi:hypothetical protein QF001_008418 [Paraburkholderia youngii]